MRSRGSPLPQIGLWLLGACLVATAFALLPLLKELPRAPGLDFYHYWGVAHARPQMPLAQSNPYRFPHEYKQPLARLAPSGAKGSSGGQDGAQAGVHWLARFLASSMRGRSDALSAGNRAA